MPFAAAHSRKTELADALDEVCNATVSEMDGATPDLTFVFLSQGHAARAELIGATIRERTGTRVLLGCTGETIVGGGEEIESGPALSVWSARLPDANIEPFHVEFARTADGVVSSGFPKAAADQRDETRAVLVLGEPFSSLPQTIIERFAEDLPGVPIIGGMASGGAGPGENRLLLDSKVLHYGAVGVVLRGGPGVRSIVSQGCRPIGTPFVVTRADENVIFELGGLPAMQRLSELLPVLPERDQSLVARGLHVGIVMNEYQDEFRRGDFLIFNVIGADREQGAIAIGNRIRTGQTIQFHVRDAESADDDLRQLLKQDRVQHLNRPQAALLFSCNGRGTRMFPEPHHDAAAIQQQSGPIPLAGFFAQGELGPVGGKNYIHGYTASVAIFE